MDTKTSNAASSHTSTASNTHAVALRRRHDLIAERRIVRGKVCWYIKDPWTLRHYEIRDEEYQLLCMLNGDASYEQIRRQFEERFAPARLHRGRFAWLVGRFHRDGLVIADGLDQGNVLWQRRQSAESTERQQRWLNPLAIRWRGINPDQWLTQLHGTLAWIYRPIYQWANGLFFLVALLWVLLHAHEFTRELSSGLAWFSVSQWLLFAATLAFVKVLHEFGHGLTCKHFGGECHELGLMLLIGTPCLYCNVSDAWMLNSRWHRAAVGLAGIWVELWLASVAVFGWWFTEPGIVHNWFASLLIVCGISTVLLNGNPLLRYDGYYVLSDLLDRPQLAEQASLVWQRWWSYWWGRRKGTELETELPLEGRFWLMIYGAVAKIYRITLLLLIGWSIWRWADSNQLPSLGVAGVLLMLGGMFVPLITRAFRERPPLDVTSTGRARRGGTLAVAFVLFSGFLFVPLPTWRTGIAVFEVFPSATVYAPADGILSDGLRYGQWVEAGQTIATLKSYQQDLDLAKSAGDVAVQLARVEHLEAIQSESQSASRQILVAREMLTAYKSEAERQADRKQQLVVRTSVSGYLSRPIERASPLTDPALLETWNGFPLDPETEAQA